MLDRAETSSFGSIKTNLEKNMTCVIDSYPNNKDKTVVLINSYHMSEQNTNIILVK